MLPTLKRVIPFQSLDEWNRNADRYLAGLKEANAAPHTEAAEDDGEAKEEG